MNGARLEYSFGGRVSTYSGRQCFTEVRLVNVITNPAEPRIGASTAVQPCTFRLPDHVNVLPL
jgi:hypothetical protein